MKPESTTPQPAAPAPTTKQIKKDITYAYNEHGQSSAFDVANSYGVGYEYCKGCETDSPSIEHECLICGQTNAPAPISREVEGFTPGEWEAKKITSTQIIIGIKGYGEGDNYRKDNRCGQIAQIHGWDGNGKTKLSPEDLANAELIARCPTLYRENKELKEYANYIGDKIAAGDDEILTFQQWIDNGTQ